MTKVSKSSICPYCKTNLLDFELETGFTVPKALKDRCPSCNKIIRKPSNELFESPDYIHHQMTTLMEEARNSKRFESEKDLEDQWNRSENALYEWFRRCLHEDRVAALSDAVQVIEHLIYSNASREEIGQLMKLTARIEKVSAAVRNFMQIGGPLYEREVRRIRTHYRDADGGEAAASAGRDT